MVDVIITNKDNTGGYCAFGVSEEEAEELEKIFRIALNLPPNTACTGQEPSSASESKGTDGSCQ